MFLSIKNDVGVVYLESTAVTCSGVSEVERVAVNKIRRSSLGSSCKASTSLLQLLHAMQTHCGQLSSAATCSGVSEVERVAVNKIRGSSLGSSCKASASPLQAAAYSL
ncbi:hypothetical protein QYF36_007055 [Acer negundo]|nr:hypothetical protein QYF36_007055 [Acer negundo]